MSDQTPNTDMTVTYGEFKVDFATLPHTSVMAMLRRGVSHFFGSEQAAKVSGFFDPDQDVPPEDTKEARAAKKAEYQAKAYDALIAGTVGVSTRQPTVDPITKILRKLAKAEVMGVLTEAKLKWPKKAEDVVTFPNGDKFTGSTLIDRRIANPKHAERLMREAKKEFDDNAKKAAKKAASAKEEALTDL